MRSTASAVRTGQPDRVAATPAPSSAAPRPAATPSGPAPCACGGSCPRCSGRGMPLVGPLRRSMEARLGTDFSTVRIHSDEAAARTVAQQRANAFTVGEDILFGGGRFAAGTGAGAALLAHELVHVVQQRRGRRGDLPHSMIGAEQEARTLGPAVAAGAPVAVRGATPRTIQRDGPTEDTPLARPTRPLLPVPQLTLDPEVEALVLRHYLRWWIGHTLVDGHAPGTLPAGGQPLPNAAAAEPTIGGLPGIAGLPTGSIVTQLPLTGAMYQPLPPGPFLQPDAGALFTPFRDRLTSAGPGDSAVVFDIYQRNQAITAALPDLRALAPRPLRGLIPTTWRRDIAGALTGATVKYGLQRDRPTPIEISDRAWEGLTGASTTVIPLPPLTFDLF